MNKIAKYIKNTPVLLIWMWLFVFFADSANLDDFLNNITVIHTDDPTDNVNDDYPEVTPVINSEKAYSTIPLDANLLQINKIVFDQDSPSLAPEFITNLSSINENISEKRVSLVSVSLFKDLYLEYHSLLI